MPCYFVSNGIEMSMTNQTFDIIWNGFGNKELADSETPSSSKEGDKTGLLVEKARNAEWRKQDDGYYNRKPNHEKYFQRWTKRKRNNRVYAIYAALPWAVNQTWQNTG